VTFGVPQGDFGGAGGDLGGLLVLPGWILGCPRVDFGGLGWILGLPGGILGLPVWILGVWAGFWAPPVTFRVPQ